MTQSRGIIHHVIRCPYVHVLKLSRSVILNLIADNVEISIVAPFWVCNNLLLKVQGLEEAREEDPCTIEFVAGGAIIEV